MTTRKKAADEQVVVPPERLMDLIPFYVGFDAYLSWLEQTGAKPDATAERGEALARRYLGTLDEAAQVHFSPIVERPDAARLQAPFSRWQRSGSPVERARAKAAFLRLLFEWFRSHQTVFRDLFAGKSRKAGMSVLTMLAEDDPVAIIRQGAAIPAVSGLQTPRKWLADVATKVGAGLSPAQTVLADVESLANLAVEAQRTDALLAGAAPGTDKAAELAAQKAAILAKMEENAGGDVVALQAAAAAAYKPHTGHQTETGQRLSLNADQEAAMVASGKKVIAAGAGSGKTRVLAGEVAYRINELGYDASSVCAVSFTRKASKELIKRVMDYGAVIDGAASSGFGTTHFLAGVTILGKYGKSTKRPKYFSQKQNWAVTNLVTLAVRQVGMKGGSGKAPQPKNAFTDRPTQIPQATLDMPVPNFAGEANPETARLLSILDKGITLFSTGWPSWFKGGDWGRWATQFLSDMKRKIESGTDPNDLSDAQKAQINKLMGHIQKEYGVSMRLAAVDEEAEAEVPEAASPNIERKGMSKYQYWDQPARQWFNLGFKWEGSGDKSGAEGQQFSAAGVKRKIDIWKGMGATPEEIWYAAGPAEGKVQPYSPEAAAYAAYEWLKGRDGEPDFRNTGDMNDLLIDATRTLVHNPSARGALQSRFKVILVDEAQDLNRTQHVLFGLLAGALDPQTLQPHPDGSMTADTFGFIGDDKQAIYEFRGAEPDEFIEKSNLVPEGGDFQTLLLDTNYRSGQAIVEAANQLIKHNKKQIPMTCKANYEVKGDGNIQAESYADQAEAADKVAETIADYAEANSTGKAKYSNYGIAVRSNAEAMHYALGMVKKAIPFKSKVNPFKSPPVKAMLGWMALVEGGPTMSRDAFLAAVSDALLMPSSFLGKAFTNRLEKVPDPVQWVRTMDPDAEFQRGYARNVQAFMDNLTFAFGLSGSPEGPTEVYGSLLTNLKSADGKTFFEGIVSNIKENNDKMAELAAENPDGIPTDEQIEEAAEEELVLLSGLMGAKDSVTGVMSYVRELKAVNEKVAAGDDEDKDAVTIGTMHSWKGLEVPRLFVPLVRGKFPRVKLVKNPISGEIECESPDPNDPALASERRLAYVAITRAEDSCVMMDIGNPSKAFQGCPPSQFISEACVQWSGPPPVDAKAEAEVAEIESTHLASLWDTEQPMWEEPEADEFGPMLSDMDKMEVPGPDSGDPLLAEWFKTTGGRG